MDEPITLLDRSSARPSLSLERFLRLLFLQREATRQDLGKLSGFSPASITLRSQWLQERGYLQKSLERVQHSKRPVETLSLRDQKWSVLAVGLTHERLVAQLVTATADVVGGWELPLGLPVQRAFFEQLGVVYQLAKALGEKVGKPLKGVGLSVDGIISEPRAGIIFRLNGGGAWEPCHPKFSHPLIPMREFLSQWTSAVCKLHGAAARLKSDVRLAYIHVDRRDLHLAMMNEGVVTLGRQGTSGHFLHQSVRADGPACYCGRAGCLDALLRAGKVPPQMLYGALQRLIESQRIENLAVEWDGCPEEIREAFGRSVPRSLTWVSDGQELERAGLAILTAEAALLGEMQAASLS